MNFDELHERYADGTLTPPERAEFLALLETAAGRARFAETASYEAALSEELKVSAAVERKGSSRTLPRVGSRRIPIVAAPEPDESRTLGWIGALAAAAVVVILTLVFATTSRSKAPQPTAIRLPVPQKVDSREPDLPRREDPVAAPLPAPRPVTPEPAFVPAPAAPKKENVTPVRVEVVKPIPPPAPAPRPEEEKPRATSIFVATVETLSGEVHLGKDAAELGKGIPAGQSMSTGRDAYLCLRYPDGSRIEFAGDTLVSRLQDGPAGKSALLESGMVFVDAAKQPAGKPMVITTAQAESTVIGTQFVLTASPLMTRIDVREGRVKFTRLPQGVSSVVVTTGHYAVIGPTGELVSKAGLSLWKAPMSGLQLWLRADAGTKMNGQTVAAWLDQSMTGNTAVQDKPAAQPLLVANALGGRPALRFDGNDDCFVLPDGFSDFRLGLTAFVVVRPAAGGAWSRFIDLDVGPACDNIVFGRKDAPDKLGFWVYANSQTKGKVEAAGAVLPDQVQTFCALMNPMGHVTLYKNGTALATGDTTMPKSTTRKPNGIAKSNAGGGEPNFKGDLFELLLYNRGLSETERAYVESYLNAKYLDAATPPANLRSADK
jgi:hypothetical protein